MFVFNLIFLSQLTFSQPTTFESLRPLVRQNRIDDALKNYPDLAHIPSSDQALAQFLKGRLLYLKEQFSDALPLFEAAAKDKTFTLTAYADYHIGFIQNVLKNEVAAKNAFQKALQSEPNRDLQNLINFQQADMAIHQKHYDEAGRLLRQLEKRWKHDVRYPELLYRELKVEMARHHAPKVCKIARKLYAEFPGHALVNNWTIQLQNVMVDDRPLSCLVSSKDQIRRIRRLQWSGFSDRARGEIEYLRSKQKQPSYFLDSMLAQFLVSDGAVDEAIQILLKHYDLQKNNFGYLTLLARAAGRAGEYETAVGAYYKAYQLAQGSRVGREALFQSAFLSYQFQDYDGAVRKFNEFVSHYSRSGLTRDAFWHLAWIRYLKGDFEGALKSFATIEGQGGRRRHRQKVTSDRIRYWQAMALLRLNRWEEARPIFQQLALDKGLGFYAFAAHYRLLQSQPPSTRPLPQPSLNPLLTKTESPAPPVEAEAASNEESEESEETMSITKDDNGSIEGSETNEDNEPEEPELEASSFKSHRLAAAFGRANDLIRLGLYEWARMELYEIESRTRNKNYLQSLMSLYEKTDSFFRSSSIADLQFANERTNGGLEKAKSFWQSAFPQAYEAVIKDVAKKFDVPGEWVLSIMRAESQYRTDVISPVGAKGLMQLMPPTGVHLASLLGIKDFNELQLLDPEMNIRLGAKYLSRLSTRFEKSLPLVAAAYNAGPHRVESWLMSFGTVDMDEFIEHIPFVETRDYVKKVIRNMAVYLALYQSDESSLSWIAKQVTVKAPKKISPRETWEM